MTMPEATLAERKSAARGLIYRYLYEAETARSKPEIAAALSLSMPTVHQNVSELLRLGYVCPAGLQQSRGGRPAVGYKASELARFALGVLLTRERIRIVATDLRLESVAYKSIESPLPPQPQVIGSRIAAELERFMEENGLNRQKLLGVGIALPAIIDAPHNKIQLAPTLQLQDIDLDEIQRCIPYPTFVENDGNCGGCAEWFMRTERTSIVYLSLEEGVGGSILIDGVPYNGVNGRSAEFGHICIVPGGRACQCGKHGCLEAYCSTLRLTRDLGLSADEFFAALGRGNPQYNALWQDYLDHLASGINAIRMVMDCDVVLGGYLAQYLGPYLPQLRAKAAARNTFAEGGDYIRLGRDLRHAAVRGAALHYIRKFPDEV